MLEVSFIAPEVVGKSFDCVTPVRKISPYSSTTRSSSSSYELPSRKVENKRSERSVLNCDMNIVESLVSKSRSKAPGVVGKSGELVPPPYNYVPIILVKPS